MTTLQWAGWISWLLLTIRYFPREFFPKLRNEDGYQHFVFSSAVVLCLLWSIQAGIHDGLKLHFLAVTVLVLCHGWRIAMLICLLPTLLLIAFGKVAIADAGLFAVTTFLLPGMFSYMVFALSYQYLTRHLFVYIFIAGFLNAAFTIVLHISLTSGWFWLEGLYSWNVIVDNYLQLALLIWFPEALLNGMAVTLMSVYRPHWLRTFYDNDYLSPDR